MPLHGLYFHGGQVHALPCGCKAYQHIDHSQPGTPVLFWYKKHPLHTAKCFRHTGDSDDMALRGPITRRFLPSSVLTR